MARRVFGLVLALGLAAGCAPAPEPAPPAEAPTPAPTDLRQDVMPDGPVPPRSAASRALAEHYRAVEIRRRSRGLLRTDGGGPDAPITRASLVRNFATIALQEEYTRGEGLSPATGEASAVKKWRLPVRIVAEFGPSVPGDQAIADRNALIGYARRLSDITGHPISVTDGQDANFRVLFVGADDLPLVAPRIRAILPNTSERVLTLFDRLPRGIHCLVLAFSREPGGYEYGNAIAVIRAEHPDLMRLSCIHEEVAQALGLANDSRRARPSIFNDDEEFALLTGHDALLLQILYDPALEPGMDLETAMPIVQARARALLEQGS